MVLSVQFRFEYKHDWLVGDSFVRYFGFKMGFFEKMIGTILLNDVKVRQSRNVFFKLTKNERRNSFFLPNSTMANSFHSFFGRI